MANVQVKVNAMNVTIHVEKDEVKVNVVIPREYDCDCLIGIDRTQFGGVARVRTLNCEALGYDADRFEPFAYCPRCGQANEDIQ